MTKVSMWNKNLKVKTARSTRYERCRMTRMFFIRKKVSFDQKFEPVQHILSQVAKTTTTQTVPSAYGIFQFNPMMAYTD